MYCNFSILVKRLVRKSIFIMTYYVSNQVKMINKKAGIDRFSNFMSLGAAELVPRPVVTNGNEMCRISSR